MSYDIYGFLRDSIFIMIAWFLIATSFFIWGKFLAKILRIKINGIKRITTNIWLGWVFCIFFFSIYNLFLPINAFASCLFYFPGIIVFGVKYWNKMLSFYKSIAFIKRIAIILTLFLAATVAIQLPMNFDNGLYHFNNVRWANEHHIIKGLGNLHSRLGFNQLFFLYAASLNFHPYLNDYAFHAVNSFLYALFCVSMILSGACIDLILLCLFFFIPMPYFWINNPNPDIASTIIQIITFRYFIEAINCKQNNKNSLFALVAIFASIMVSLKLSNAVFAIGLCLLTIYCLVKYPIDKNDNKPIKTSLSFILIFFIIWLIRGYIQTGYPLFPSTIGQIKFEWSVSNKLANRMTLDVYVHSRLNNYDHNSPLLKDYAWLNTWLKENFINIDSFEEDWFLNIYTIILMIFFPMTMFYWGIGSLTIFCLGLFLFLIWNYRLLKDNKLWNKSKIIFYLFLSEIVSIIFWFFTAPNPRFANGIFVVFFMTSLMLLKISYPNLKSNKTIKNCLMFYSFIMFIICFYTDYSANEFKFNGMIVLQKVAMKEYISNYGLKILVPKYGYLAWDSELPSTPEPNKNLALLGSTLDDGFCMKE